MRGAELPAEVVYLFRHATLRDAAYQLLPPSQRSRLHMQALEVLEEGMLTSGLDAAAELAQHARMAQEGVTLIGTDLPLRELRYLRLSAVCAAGKYENSQAADLWQRIARHPASTKLERADAMAEAGLLSWMLGRGPEALQLISQAIDLCGDDKWRKAYCLIERGTMHRDVRENDDAMRDLSQALELARQCGDKQLQLRALGNLCTVQDQGLTRAGAVDLYAPVIKLAREIGDVRAIGISEGQIGQAALRGGNYAEAETHLREAIRLLRETGDRLNECEMTGALGDVFRERTDGDRRGNLMQAVQLQRAALQMKESLGFLFQKAHPLAGLAAAHRLLGMYPEAERYAREALEVATEVGDPQVIGIAYLERAALFEAQGDLMAAERALSYGIVAIEDSQADETKVELLAALAQVTARAGDAEAALSYAQTAEAVAETSGDTRIRTRARLLVRSLQRSPDPA
jgi:tetratricopeptide (TPR) repeat protein